MERYDLDTSTQEKKTEEREGERERRQTVSTMSIEPVFNRPQAAAVPLSRNRLGRTESRVAKDGPLCPFLDDRRPGCHAAVAAANAHAYIIPFQ